MFIKKCVNIILSSPCKTKIFFSLLDGIVTLIIIIIYILVFYNYNLVKHIEYRIIAVEPYLLITTILFFVIAVWRGSIDAYKALNKHRKIYYLSIEGFVAGFLIFIISESIYLIPIILTKFGFTVKVKTEYLLVDHWTEYFFLIIPAFIYACTIASVSLCLALLNRILINLMTKYRS